MKINDFRYERRTALVKEWTGWIRLRQVAAAPQTVVAHLWGLRGHLAATG